MTPPVYSRNLYSAAALTAGSHTAFTVPSGHVYIVTDVDYVNLGASAAVASLQDVASGAYFTWQTVPSTGYVSWRGRAIFEAGNSLALAFGGSGFYVKISGYDLTN